MLGQERIKPCLIGIQTGNKDDIRYRGVYDNPIKVFSDSTDAEKPVSISKCGQSVLFSYYRKRTQAEARSIE